MRKALRIILPIMLIITILISAFWYLLVYDPEFTRDTIMATARELDNNGHHKTAAWFYDLAYLQSKGGDEVAIELAEHYKSIGNYTKAEFTLSKAISDGGTVDLYVALCKTYVEQDKILDAVNMLANIKDVSIKTQIDALRPAMPVFDPAPGFYSQYITVTVKSENSNLYINTNGEYPSITDTANSATSSDASSVSVSLPQGETTIYAVAIGENSLVSELAIQGYTIGGVIEEVKLSDPAFDEYIRTRLNYSATRTIYTDDLWEITELELPAEVNDYSDLKHFPYLQSLSIVDCEDRDLSALSGLTELRSLSIVGGRISQDSLKVIGTLKSLERLVLQDCNLSSIAPLDGLTNLTYLDLSKNALRNIGVFSGFTKLQELHMGENALTDLDAISNLSELKIINVPLNSIQSIKPLFSVIGLTELNISDNALEDIDGIGALTSLSKLNLNQNLISDIAPLAGCTALTELDVSGNKLKEITVIGTLTNLVRLNFSHNEITELPTFADNHKLAAIDASYNQLTTIDKLSSLNELYFVDIDHNADVETLDPLLGNHMITNVNCFGTKVAVDPFPKDQGVVVNLDPSIVFKPEA